MKKYRVAFCENGAGYGGAIISLEAFLEHIDPIFKPYIVTGLKTPEYQALTRFGVWQCIPSGTLFGRVSERVLPRRFQGIMDNAFNIIPTALKYAWFFSVNRVDVVYLNNDPFCNMAAALGAFLSRKSAILHMRGYSVTSKGSRWVVSTLAHGLPISSVVAENLTALGMTGDKQTLVPEGIDLSLFKRATNTPGLRDELGIGPNTNVVTLVAGLVDWKGQDTLIAAAPMVLARNPDTVFLLVGGSYGRDDNFEKQLRRQVREYCLTDKVRFLGSRKDVTAFLNISTIVLHTSTIPEPFGRTVIEAMAAGKAIIASNEGGPAEVIRDGVDGILIPPKCPEKLASAISDLLENPERRQELEQRAELKAAGYSIERHAEIVNGALKSVVNKSGVNANHTRSV